MDVEELAKKCMYNIGKQYYEDGDYDKSLEYLQNLKYEDSEDIVASILDNPMSLNHFIERYNNLIDALSSEVEYLSAYKLDATKMSNNKIEFESKMSTIHFKFNGISNKNCKYEVDSAEFYMKGWILTSSDLLAAIQFALYGAYAPDMSADHLLSIINQLYDSEASYMGTSRCAVTENGIEYICTKTKQEIRSIVRNDGQ